MRSGLTQSRPVSEVNISRSWPDPGSQSSSRLQAGARPRRQLVLAPAEGWLPLLLLTIAVYSVIYSVTAAILTSNNSVTAASTTNNNSVLWITTALGLVSGLIISKSRALPQAILHIGACLIGYWVALIRTSILAYHVFPSVLLSNLRTVITNGLSLTGTVNGDMVFLFYLSFLCFFLGYFGSWLIYRAHLPWLVAMVYISIMLVNLNFITKQDLSFLIIILVGSLILLIARVQLASQLTQWKNDGLYTDQAWLRSMSNRFLRIASLFVLLILPFSWLLPIMGQPAAGVNLWNGLDNAWANLSHGHLPSLSNPSGLFSPYDPSGNFFSDQLSITGSVNLPSGPVLSYTSSDSQGHYLESFTFDAFDGHQWTTQLSSNNQPFSANARLPLDSSNASYTSLFTRIKIIQPPGGTKHFIFAPPIPDSFTVPVTLFLDTNSTFISSWTQTSVLTANEQYMVNSELVNAPASDLRQIPLPSDASGVWTDDPNYTLLQQYYLQKPASLSPEVLATARSWTAGSKNTYDLVSALQAHLSNPADFTYSLHNDPIPSNEDVITWLLHTRKGFCTYYATAMVIMVRMLGFPARMVNGFSQGHFDQQQNAWVVDGSDAHSWVQVYFPGYGWINFDPTPGCSVTNGVTPNSILPARATTPAPKDPTAPANATPAAQLNRTANQIGRSVSPPSTNPFDKAGLLMGLSLLILLCSLAVLGFSIVHYRNKRAGGSVSTVYARLCHLATLVGSPPAQWQTPYEYTFNLSKRFPQVSAGLHYLADLVVRERWATPRQAPDWRERQALEHLWPRMRNTILRSPFSRKR